MHNLTRNIVLSLIALFACVLAIVPPQEKLRLGKDLAGGMSLVYSIQTNPGDPPDVVAQTIEVIKERIDPDGVLDISIVQQGRNRLEITAPLPSERVKQLRAEFEAALEDFKKYELDPDALERALRQQGDARQAAIENLIDRTPGLAPLLEPLVELAAAADESRASYERAVADGLPEAATDELLGPAAEAELALDEARERALASAVSIAELREAFELPTDRINIRNSETGEIDSYPSRRERAFNSMLERTAELDGSAEVIAETQTRHAAYVAERRGFDDPNDLIRLLQGSGVLNFRIAVDPSETDVTRLRTELQERGPGGVRSTSSRWYPINKLEDWYDETSQLESLIDNPAAYFSGRGLVAEEYQGGYYLLLSDEGGERLSAADGEWTLSGAFAQTDDRGRPAIGFSLDTRGGDLMGRMTSQNVGRTMCYLLDGTVYGGATIQGRIAGRGQITGQFSATELNYIIKTLNAGSLQARLSERPISNNTLAPELGADNLARGLQASIIALIVVASFMAAYYFSSGFVAVIALMCNAVVILGLMALARAAFTLPGIAGVVLTFGMAVDANVLIYERVREELLAGNDLRTAVRLAYKKVLSTILDANITNLMVCFVLAYTATQEVRGFAITLGIGIVGTLFSCLIITRIVFSLLVDKAKVKRMRQLPMVVPFIQRALEPRIDWIGLRPVFLVISACLVGLGLSMIYIQRGEMLDTEFRGGTAITMRISEETGTLTRAEVQERVQGAYEQALARTESDPDDRGAQLLLALQNADVIAIDAQADGVTSDRFRVVSSIAEDPDTDIAETVIFRNAIVEAFSDVVDSQPALRFRGAETPNVSDAPIYRVLDAELGRNIGRPEIRNDVRDYLGGVAIVLENVEPATSVEAIEERLTLLRSQPDFSATLERPHEVLLIEGTPERVETVVLLAQDPGVSVFDDEQQWRVEVAETEWRLARGALTNATTLASLQSFSPSIARTFRAQAIVAVILSFLLILGYIWFRFGSVRYSLAAITALVHDVLIAVGLIAVAEIVYKQFPGVAAIGIQPFKIDLALVAAILTIVGYSLNDTIVILDRIRENRGRLAYASRSVVNLSINQTISRTVITSGTTTLALLVLFFFGGDALGSFTYALLCGVLVGTYSSIAVAAPLVYTDKIPPAAQPFAEAEKARHGGADDKPGALPAT
ncbi:MAG: protein translocase subunit SecD [Planctomycetota bacterium]